MSAMWKPSQSGPTTPSFTPEPSHSAPPASSAEYPNRAPATTGEQATVGKGLFFKGEITGSESLFIDGKVEGTIVLPGNRVTIGRNGQVASNIDIKKVEAKPAAETKPFGAATASAAPEPSKPAL